MQLTLRNSLTGLDAPFTPIDPTRVRVYACGPTVYGRAHIGNLRAAVSFDLLVRVLRGLYGAEHVVFARNLTDVDDKITDAARTRFPGVPLNDAIGAVAEPAIAAWHADTAALGARPADIEPRATRHIVAMQDMIATLVQRGHAYTSQGHVLFSVADAPQVALGALGRRPDAPEEAVLHSRTGALAAKRHPQDFVLWKPSGPDHPAWPSPWGLGRPGWHIECSAMAKEHLGERFDLHAGGRDLMVPHHANEILQSACSCSGHPEVQAHTWVHSGLVTVEGVKMSKSLGNILTMDDLSGIAPVVVRLAFLTARYRSDFDWSDALVAQSTALWRRLFAAAQGQDPGAAVPDAVWTALLDDLNTPQALAALALEAEQGGPGVAAGLALLGLMDAGHTVAVDPVVAGRIDALVEARKAARAAKDWAESDRVRGLLAAAGVALSDGPQGTTWSVLPGFQPDILG
jgi:cysteinyl-tRNA synthetase